MQDIPALLGCLKRSGPILSQFVQSIPAETMHRRRGDGFWTPAEHLAHLAEVQPMMLGRLQRFMDEDHPEFVPFIPGEGEAEDRPPQMEAAEALTAFADVRNRQVALLEAADADTWQKTGSHPEYEQYSLYILVRHILMHDHWHMYRMEELWLTREAYLTKL
jgi:uncharacterized damage-inducible protein DinB